MVCWVMAAIRFLEVVAHGKWHKGCMIEYIIHSLAFLIFHLYKDVMLMTSKLLVFNNKHVFPHQINLHTMKRIFVMKWNPIFFSHTGIFQINRFLSN